VTPLKTTLPQLFSDNLAGFFGLFDIAGQIQYK
jgi:hypothetical protein